LINHQHDEYFQYIKHKETAKITLILHCVDKLYMRAASFFQEYPFLPLLSN
jgi:hypothetical protein